MTDVPLSLLSYLIPGDFVKARIPFIRKKNDDSVPSTATRAFDPPLQRPTRIPHLVVSDPPSKILANLSELLKSLTYEQIANAEASPDVTAAYHVLQRNCQRLMIVISSHKHSKESSVGEVASALVQPIHEAYEQLTGGSIAAPEYETEVNTDDRVVRTDRTYVIGDKVKILWEDKGRPVFLFHKADMLERLRPNGSGLFVTHPEQPIQMNWEGVEAILAKISYHAIDADLPNWAIIFGGDLYMVLFLHHTKDSDDENRVAIVCSDILSIYHNGPGIYPFNRLSDENILSLYQEDQASAATYTTELPLCSAVLYMLMTSLGDGDGLTNSKSLEEKLKISIKKPVALGLGLGRRCAGGKTSTDTTLPSTSVYLETYDFGFQNLWLATAIPVAASSSYIYLDQLCGSSNTSLVYSRARELSKQGVLSENQAYQYLQDKDIYFIPKYKGMYTWPGGFALILSDEGQAIADSGSEFKELAWWKRIQLFVYITELHRIGVLHGDFEPRNVVQKGLRTRIIDFTHSSIDHSCPGWRGCPELKRARNKLGLGFLTDWLLSVASLCTLSEGIDRARALIFLFVILSLFKLFSLCGILSHQTLRGFIFSARKIG